MADFFDDPYDANYDFSFLDNYIYGIQKQNPVPQQSSDGFYQPDEEETTDNSSEEQSEDSSGEQPQNDQALNDYLLNQDESSFFDNSDVSSGNSDDGDQSLTEAYNSAAFIAGSSNPSQYQNFGSYQEGKAALIRQLDLYQTGRTKNRVGPNSTLLEAMSVYAPSSDHNDPQGYASFIAKRLGVSVDTPISQIDTSKWADAIEKMEGNKVGNNPGNLKKYQTGGIAKTKRQQYVGLNNNSLDNLILPLKGQNPIRGLDSRQPVEVSDNFGNYDILYGPDDVNMFQGPVYEKRLKR